MNTTATLVAVIHDIIDNGTQHFATSDGRALSLESKVHSLEASLHYMQRNVEDFYFVTLTILTFAMQCGFAFMEVGLVRTKNTTNVLLKSTIDAFVGCISFWLFGYAIAWSDGNCFVGWQHFAFYQLPADKLSMAFYQLIFSNTASTIVSGAVAERLNFPCYFIYAILLTGFGYPFISRWGWYDGGWLRLMGFRDFGGSGIVHMYSGACAFIAALVIGPRIGRFASEDAPSATSAPSTLSAVKRDQHIPGHSVPFVGLGALLLMFGFLGFNASSQLSIIRPGDGASITYAAFNTLLGGSGGALSALMINRFLPYWGCYWSYITMVNGALAGMAGICAACNSLAPLSALVTGFISGVAFILLRSFMEKVKVDDPIDAFPIHFGGGLVGLLTAPFLVPDGIFFKADYQSAVVLGCNVLGILVIIVWAVLCCLPLFILLKKLGILRIDDEMETGGMDAAKHNEDSYPPSAWQNPRVALIDADDAVQTWIPHQSDKLNPPLVAGLTYRKRGVFLDPRPDGSMNAVEPRTSLQVVSIGAMDLGECNVAYSGGASETCLSMAAQLEKRVSMPAI